MGKVTGFVAPPDPILESKGKVFTASGGIPAKHAKPVTVWIILFSVLVFVMVTKPALFRLFSAIFSTAFSHKKD
jgi:hypothetical protein